MNKTKYTSFHKYPTREKNPLKLPTLKKGNKVIKKPRSIKFLGVILDENVSWRYRIKTVENKLPENISLSCRSKQFLVETFLKTITIHFTKLKTISYKHETSSPHCMYFMKTDCTIQDRYYENLMG